MAGRQLLEIQLSYTQYAVSAYALILTVILALGGGSLSGPRDVINQTISNLLHWIGIG
jgi:hypothetical protein